jgi:tetratricopeptide (TPR) repeat protein
MKSPFTNRRALVFAALVIFCFSFLKANPLASAQDERLPKRAGQVNDFGEVLDVDTRARLETILENLKQRTDVDFVIATVKTTGTEDIYDYSFRVAREWKLGAPAAFGRSALIVIAADNKKFFSQTSPGARLYFPAGLISDLTSTLRDSLDSVGFSGGLISGIKTFVDRLGQKNGFDFAMLDTQGGNTLAQRQRPRTVGTPAAAPEPSQNPQPTPTETATPEAVAKATPSPESSPQATQTPEATAAPSETPATSPAETPSASPSETPAPTQSPAQTPAETPAATPATTPAESPTAETSPAASPEATLSAANNSVRSAKATDRKASPEDEKEEVELTLTKPLDERIQLLKAFIGSHPTSVALPRAHELLVVARALLGDKKLQAGDTEGGLQLFRAAIAEAPSDMPDRLFTDIIARIPLNLFFRGQRDAAFETARQAEAISKSNSRRLVALTQFYLTIENADEAARIAEAALQLTADSAAAHQALGAARHIALRLDEAESEYARALSLDPKLAAARIALADMKRAGGKPEEALALYREQLQTDAKSNTARAGLVLSLLEVGKKDEADAELKRALDDPEEARNLPLLVGAAYWFTAHSETARALELAQKAIALEPRYSWAEIALARALVADGKPLQAERALRYARQFGRFPTVDYELATVLASLGLYDEAAQELARSFTLKNGEIETKLAGRLSAHATSFTELLAPERRAAIFQPAAADTAANAMLLKSLMAFQAALERPEATEDDLVALAQDFIKGEDAMRTYRQIYVAGRFLKKGVALVTVVELMDSAARGVDVALTVPAATVAVQAEELSDTRAKALAQGTTPDVPDAPRSALDGLLRGRIEDIAGLAFFNLDKPAEAVTRLRRAVMSATEGTPLSRSAMWHLGAALEATGKNDQALLYYIKSYVKGPPDAARRSVIENVYKKVNGSLDGLEDKIGPGFAAASASPTPNP